MGLTPASIMEKAWAFWAKNAFVKKGRSVVLEIQREETRMERKVGMPPGQHLWHQGALSGGGWGGEREQKGSTGRRLIPQVETQYQSHMKASTKMVPYNLHISRRIFLRANHTTQALAQSTST